MKSIFMAAIVATIFTAPANAALVASFQLNGSLADALGGPAITNNGGTLGGSGITFSNNQGPSLGGFSNTAVYSIAIEFSFDNLGGYRKIIDFKSRTSDTGLYAFGSGLNFYPVTTATNQFTAGQATRLVVTRDAAGTFTGNIGDSAVISFLDSSNLATITSDLHFFRDDFATGQFESEAGFVNYIKIYDTALTAEQVAGLGGGTGSIPEPASWAMMIAGFGLVGAAMRRRGRTPARA